MNTDLGCSVFLAEIKKYKNVIYFNICLQSLRVVNSFDYTTYCLLNIDTIAACGEHLGFIYFYK